MQVLGSVVGFDPISPRGAGGTSPAPAAHRYVRCQADCRRLSFWSSAHLPLYLGIALAGIGTEHAITGGGWQVLHGEELWLVALALGLVAGSLGALRAAR